MNLFENTFSKYYIQLNEKMVYVHDGSIENDQEDIDEEEIFDQVDDLERQSSINILRGKELTMVYLTNKNEVAGALYIEVDGDEFSFDVIVHKDFQGKGIGSKLIDAALAEFNYNKDGNDELELKVDVVNELMKKALEKRGLVVHKDMKNRWVMGHSKEDSKEDNPKEENIKESYIF